MNSKCINSARYFVSDERERKGGKREREVARLKSLGIPGIMLIVVVC